MMISKEEQNAARLRVNEKRAARLAEKENYNRKESELLSQIPENFRDFVIKFSWDHNDCEGNVYGSALVLMEDLVDGIKASLKKGG